MAQLTLAVTKTGANQNLTSLGATDWAWWNSSTTPTDRKNGGGSLISAAIYSAGAASNYSGDPRTISWTDGTPTASSSSADGIYNTTASLGVGFEVTYPADTTTREARLFCGYYSTDVKVTAIISDASTGNQVDTTTLTGTIATSLDGLIVVTYAAGSGSQTMKIRIENNHDYDSNENCTLQAASVKTVSAASPLRFNSSLNGLSSSGPFFANPIG